MLIAESPDYAAIWTAAATTAALPLIFVAYRQFRDQARTRHAQLLVELTARWDSPSIQEADRLGSGLTSDRLLELMRAAYGPKQDKESETQFATLLRVPDFFELVGSLWRYESCLPTKAIDITWGYSIPFTWKTWEATIAELNTAAAGQYPASRAGQIYENFKLLAEEIESLPKKRWWKRLLRR
jgi:hypothetical protein